MSPEDELAAARRDLERLAKRTDDATKARDQAMLRMRMAGGTYRDIATAAGVNHQTVVNILRRLEGGKAANDPA